LYNTKSVCLLPFPDVSVTTPWGILTITWLTFESNPPTFTVYSTPYWNWVVVEPEVLSSFNSLLVNPVIFPVTSVPLTKTFILFCVNVLFAKYLSVILKLTDAVLLTALAEEVIFSTNGSTTSTTWSFPEPPGRLIPDVIVVVLFLFKFVLSPVIPISATLFCGITTETTPLYSI